MLKLIALFLILNLSYSANTTKTTTTTTTTTHNTTLNTTHNTGNVTPSTGNATPSTGNVIPVTISVNPNTGNVVSVSTPNTGNGQSTQSNPSQSATVSSPNTGNGQSAQSGQSQSATAATPNTGNGQSDQPQSATAASPSLVIELFRHGARAPLEDTYAPDWYSYQLGELTTIGQREHYLLGTALAQNYPSILGQPYNLSKIYFRSSVLARSLESASSQLYGVYQGKGPALNANSSYPSQRAFPPFTQTQIEQLNQGLNNSQAIPGGYIPIAANTTTDEGGIELLEPTQVCFNLLNDILENVLGEEALNFWNNDLASTRQQLKNMGYDLGNPYDLGTFGDALVCDYYDGRQLPGDIDPSSELYLNVTFARNWFFTKALWGTPEQRQLLSVPLFNYILTYLDRKQANTTNFEFMFLSTAETNLIDMLATLDILTADCLMANYKAQIAGQALPYPNCNYTEFASNIIVEFYQNSTASSVIFKYNDVAMPLCNNQTECSYEDFKTLVSQSTNGYTPQKYQTDCLGRSLPELQKILKNLGTAFQGANTGGDTQGKLDSIFNNFTHVLEIFEGGNPDDNSVDNGENIFENVKNDIKNDVKDHITNGLDNLFGNH